MHTFNSKVIFETVFNALSACLCHLCVKLLFALGLVLNGVIISVYFVDSYTSVCLSNLILWGNAIRIQLRLKQTLMAVRL